MCDDFGPKYKEYLDNLNTYFALKNKYIKKWQLKKRKYSRSLKNKSEYKKKINLLERNCIQCKKNGGTTFEISNGVYTAKCNAKDNKCSLNIEIKPAKYFIYDKFEKRTMENLETIKDKIIKNKLNLLFNLENEDVALGEFQNLKDEFKQESNMMKFINTHKYEELYTIPVPKLIDADEDSEKNADEGKKEEKVNRIFKTDQILKLNRTLDDNIKKFKKLLKDYRLGNDNTFLKNAMNNYIYNILPTVKDIRKLENDEMFVEDEETSTPFNTTIQYKLIKKKYKDVCKEILVEDFNIIKNRVKKKLHSNTKHKSIKKSKISVKLPSIKDSELDFNPIDISIGDNVVGKEIKIDSEKLQQLSSKDSEDMSEYMENDLMDGMDELDMNDPEMGGLYNDKDIFKFYSRSADSIPGKGKAGAGETLSDDSDFSELAGIRDWRKVLSNFHTRNDADGDILALFTSRSEEGETLNWASVEHWYHAHKFKKNNPDYFKLFSMDSKSEIATDPRKALGAGGRTGFITVDKKRKKFRDDSIKMDSDFFSNGNNEIIMEAGQRLKFTQDEHSKKVLLATKEAKLVHLETRRGQATKLVPFINTMKIRKELNGQ
jgi:predicted NAD-dependent protein-ADP-ribosyltransferase YbiA (DUF1768 family)